MGTFLMATTKGSGVATVTQHWRDTEEQKFPLGEAQCQAVAKAVTVLSMMSFQLEAQLEKLCCGFPWVHC